MSEKYIVLLIFIYLVYNFSLIIIAYSRYKIFLALKRNEYPEYKEDLGGLWVGNGGKMLGDKFLFRTPLPIHDNSTDENIKRAIARHNKVIKIFWASNLIGLSCLIIILHILN